MKRSELPMKTGVYFFYDGEECVYVGSSVNIRRRTFEHHIKSGYDDIRVFLCAEDQLTILEQKYIDLLKPRFNKAKTAYRKKLSNSGEEMDVIHISTPDGLYKELQAIAKEERRSVRGLLSLIIEEALKARGIEL